jgi:hypothetical protein
MSGFAGLAWIVYISMAAESANWTGRGLTTPVKQSIKQVKHIQQTPNHFYTWVEKLQMYKRIQG